MGSRYCVLNVKKYDFVNDKDERISGVTITYMDPTDITPNGYEIYKANMSYEKAKDFSNGPGVYDLIYRMKPNQKGKPDLQIIEAKYIKDFNINVA